MSKKEEGPTPISETVKKIMDDAAKTKVPPPAPYRIQHMVEKFMPAVRENLKKSEMLAPVAFVFSGEQWIPVIMDTTNEMTKNFSAFALRRICREKDVDCVVMITEAWSLPPEHAQEYIKNMHKGSISDHPHRIEVVSFMVETLDGDYMGSSQILPGREIKNPELIKMDRSEGRFTNFLVKRTVN